MAKCKVFYSNQSGKIYHDRSVSEFLETLETDGHTFLNMNTIVYGTSKEYMDEFRTEIIYIENQTRQVIVEKA
jgi:hypothetical protein